jgi:hypothetical protein
VDESFPGKKKGMSTCSTFYIKIKVVLATLPLVSVEMLSRESEVWSWIVNPGVRFLLACTLLNCRSKLESPAVSLWAVNKL